MKQQEAAWHPQARARPTSVAKDFRRPFQSQLGGLLTLITTGPPPFQHSSSSGSPNESVLREYTNREAWYILTVFAEKEYNRTRRVSNTDVPRPKLSNYKPAYVKDCKFSPDFLVHS